MVHETMDLPVICSAPDISIYLAYYLLEEPCGTLVEFPWQ